MFSGAGAQAILRIILLMVLARLLAPADFGVVAAAMVAIRIGAVLSQLGIAHAIVQRPELEDRHVYTAFTLSLLAGAGLFGLICLLAPLVGAFFGLDELVNVIRALALMVLIGNASLVAEGLLRRALQFRQVAVVWLAAYVLGYGVTGLALALLGFGVWALVIADLMQCAVRTLCILFLQPHARRLKIERRALGQLLYFGGGLTAWRICHAVAVEADALVVGRWLGAEALGIYTRAYHLMSVPTALIGHNVVIVLFPAMAKLQNQQHLFATAFRRGLGALALISLPTTAAFILLAPELVAVLLGPQWPEVIVPLQILAPGILFQLGTRLADAAAVALGAVYHAAWRQAFYGATVFAGAVIGQHWGLVGVTSGILIALIANFALMTALVLGLTSTPWRTVLAAHRPAAVLAAVLGIELWVVAEVARLLELLPIVILLAAGAVAGATLIFMSWATRLAILGPDGAWVLEILLSRLPGRSRMFGATVREPDHRPGGDPGSS
jgi:O-antigen/teichoic acid export membrane protein